MVAGMLWHRETCYGRRHVMLVGMLCYGSRHVMVAGMLWYQTCYGSGGAKAKTLTVLTRHQTHLSHLPRHCSLSPSDPWRRMSRDRVTWFCVTQGQVSRDYHVVLSDTAAGVT